MQFHVDVVCRKKVQASAITPCIGTPGDDGGVRQFCHVLVMAWKNSWGEGADENGVRRNDALPVTEFEREMIASRMLVENRRVSVYARRVGNHVVSVDVWVCQCILKNGRRESTFTRRAAVDMANWIVRVAKEIRASFPPRVAKQLQINYLGVKGE